MRTLGHVDASHAARWVGVMAATYASAQFVAAPILGGLSDRFGRRPVLVLSLLGVSFDYLLLAVAPSIGWLLVGRLLAGVTGANISTANAYIADVYDGIGLGATAGTAVAAMTFASTTGVPGQSGRTDDTRYTSTDR